MNASGLAITRALVCENCSWWSLHDISFYIKARDKMKN